MTGWTAVDQFLNTDPADVGCGQAMELLHVYAELSLADPAQARLRFPGIAAHLAVCGPCGQDLEGLLTAIESLPTA